MTEPQIKKQALLIGINNYQHLTNLKYARQDAEAVSESLKKNYGFSDDEIILLTDEEQGLLLPSTKEVIISHLNDLINQKADYDLFIFGFWGHGLFSGNKRYLCLQTVMEKDVAEQGLSFDELQELFINVPSKNTCMILDCCQTTDGRGDSGSLTSVDKANLENAVEDIVSQKNIKQPGVSSNVAILNSCSEGQKAYEWDERRHGIFTAHLLDAMKNQCDCVSSVVTYLGNKVKNTALKMGKAQTPFFIIKGDGDIKLPVNAKNVFISYRHVNENLVAPVLNEFDNQGISYFIDRKGILFSDPHYRILAEAIDACKLLLLFWTKEVHDNPTEIEREISAALNNRKSVLPYRIGDFVIPHDSLYFLLSNLNHYEVSEQTDETIKKLVNEVKKILQIQPTPPPQPTPKPVSWKGVVRNVLMLVLIISLIGIPAFFMKPQNASPTPGEQKVITVNGIEYSFRWCPPGEFIMGAPLTEKGLENELYGYETQHKVTFTDSVWVMETEVTVAMYDSFIKETGYHSAGNEPVNFIDSQRDNSSDISWRNPGFDQNDNNPVTCVSWEDAEEFCKWLSKKTGKKIQLPTEAFWEYACRAGGSNAYADYIDENETNSAEPEKGNELDKIGWYAANSENKTHPVKSKLHNEWNIYDMHGNVSEWCSDWMERYEAKDVTDPLGPPDGSNHVFRGGSWNDPDTHCRSAFRNSAKPDYRSNNLGFRCCIISK